MDEVNTTEDIDCKIKNKQSKIREYINKWALYIMTLLTLQWAVSCSKSNEKLNNDEFYIDYNSDKKDKYWNQEFFSMFQILKI